MAIRKIKFVAAVVCACCAVAALSCGPKVKDPIVRVGGATIGKDSFEAFLKIAGDGPSPQKYPHQFPRYFPGGRSPATFMVEVEAIYRATSKSGITQAVKSSLDWEWKQRYYAASHFFELATGDNLGFTDAQLEAYYNDNTELFNTTVKTEDGRDSTFTPPLDSIKRTVADNLFYETYPPDFSFQLWLDNQRGDSVALRRQWDDMDSVRLREFWIHYLVRRHSVHFYTRLFINEQTGADHVPHGELLYGDGKYITPDDFEVIRVWAEENRMVIDTVLLVDWLYKWKSFAERAEKIGLTKTREHRNIIRWALRLEHVFAYLRDEVIPALPMITLTEADTALARLASYERFRRTSLATEIANIEQTRINAQVDSVIFAIRQNTRITWLQEEFDDQKDTEPALLLARADSLRDAAAAADIETDVAADTLLSQADAVYRVLTDNFAFTEEGRRAYSERAKIQVDRYNINPHQDRRLLIGDRSAIDFYRRGQIFGDDETRCNNNFMIGFIYDDMLSNYPMAEANYKWILRYTPTCALATDAEFMLQHLDEPMTSIEEIQDQSARQGRKVDFNDETEEPTNIL